MVRKRRKSITTLLAVVFTAITCACMALACALTVPQSIAHAASDSQTADSFAKLEFNGATTYYDGTGADPDGGAETLATVFKAASGSSKDNPAKITLLKDRIATAVTTLEVAEGDYVEFDLNGCLLNFNHMNLAKGTTYSPITVNENGTLIIKDGNPTTPHYYTDEAANGLYVFGDSGKTLYGGVITGGFTEKDDKNANGGGCVCVLGTLVMEGGTIAGNKAMHHGGGVYVNKGTFEIKQGTVTGNVCGENGAGVYVGGRGSFIVSGANVKVDGNHRERTQSGNVVITENNAHTNNITISVGGVLVDDEGNMAAIRLTSNSQGVNFNGFNSEEQKGKTISDFFYFDDYKEGEDGNCVSGGGNHTPGSEWERDANGHWKACTACGAKVSAAAHNTSGTGGSCSVCGYSATFEVTATTGGSTATTTYETITEAWAAATAEGVTKATVKMFTNAEISDTLTVDEGDDITLDLNGCTLAHTGESGSVIKINKDGAFTLNDGDNKTNAGKITGGKGCVSLGSGVYFNGGGVYVNYGSFVMNGGTITGNNINCYGGGVYIYEGNFTMNGGVISENAASDQGGGVYIGGGICKITNGNIIKNQANNESDGADAGAGVYVDGGDFIISGAVNISDNKCGDAVNNVYCAGVDITVETLTKGAHIGISSTGVVTAGYKEHNDGVAPNEYFFPDAAGYCAGLTVDGEVNIGEHTAVTDWSHDGNKHYHECANNCAERIDEADHSIASIVVTSVTTPSYTAFDEFDKSSIDVKTHCDVCDSDVASLAANAYDVNYGNADGRNYFHAGSNKSVTVEYQTAAGQTLTGQVTGLNVAQKQVEVTWQYSADVNVQNPVWESWKDSFAYDPDSEGLKNNVRAIFDRAENDDINEGAYRGTNAHMSVTKDLVEQASVKNAGAYSFALKENDFPDYAFTNNSATLTVTPLQLEINNADNFYWVLDQYESQLRTGYIYVNESDPADENNYKYFSTAGENRTRVIRSIVRYRNDELTVKLFGARSTNNLGVNGAYDISYTSGCTGTNLGKYIANAKLEIKDSEKGNYEFILTGSLDSDRHMTAVIEADGSVTVTKEWYIAVIDNGLKSQYTDENGNVYGDEWRMFGWTYGAYKTQYAPRLEHGDPGEHNSVIDFVRNDNRFVEFVLYRVVTDAASGTRNVQIGERFSRAQFADYINASVPAGSYILHVYVASVVSEANHVHWYDGEQHDAYAARIYDSFDREFDFEVGNASFVGNTNADTLNGKTYTYDYDGTLRLFDSTFTLTVPAAVQRAGVWATAAYDGYYGEAELRYNLARWGNGVFLPTAGLDGYANQTQIPKNAGNYTVYFKLVAPNYEEYGGDTYFTVVINKAKIERPAAQSVTYDGTSHGYEVAASEPYTASSTVYTNANEAGYDIALTLKDTGNYEWEDASGASVTVKLIINRAAVEKPADQTVTYNGSAHSFGLAANAPYAVKDAASFTNAGDYAVTLSLNDKNNYAWKGSDGTLSAEDLTVKLIIDKARITVPEGVTVTIDGEYTYSVPAGALYEVLGGATFTEAGDYDITLSLKDADNYAWTNADGSLVAGKTTVIKLSLTDAPAKANPVWLALAIIMIAVVAGEVGYLIFRGVRGNKKTEAKE